VPVVGALVLAAIIAQDASRRAATAAALGSIEDLAHVTGQMSVQVQTLQRERARAALRVALRGKNGEHEAVAELEKQYRETDAASASLEQFLGNRDMSKLPPRLRRDLGAARREMGRLRELRSRLATEDVPLEEILTFYGRIDEALVAATAALSQLSDDGELLRSIAALVAVAELSERVSAEHALLSYVAGTKQFPPGAFKTFVTLVTEQGVYADVFRGNAADDLADQWTDAQASQDVKRAIALRDKVLTNTDDEVDLDANEWFALEESRIGKLAHLEDVLMRHIADAATRKVAATHASIRVGVGLSAIVVVASALLGLVIGGGVKRTVVDLASAAARVRDTKDFGVRAKKTSGDELGMLTDAFNEMLSGIQVRDAELTEHRSNLEAMVAARTAQLAARNEAMRLVLDNVEQGLAMVRPDGTLEPERSAAFDAMLGTPGERVGFHEHVAGGEESLAMTLQMGWEQALEGYLPVDVALGQLPTKMLRDGRHYTLGYKPVVRDEQLGGALLVITDVTGEVVARAEQEKQREYVSVFERIAQDRDGFAAFADETGSLVALVERGIDDVAKLMAAVHTIKGSAAQWGVTSVAAIAHGLETKIVETQALPAGDELAELVLAWQRVGDRFAALVGRAQERIDVTRAEMDDLAGLVRSGASHDVIASAVERLRHEPTAVRFQRMEEEIARLAGRVGKPKPEVRIEANGVRLPATRFGSFWAATVHVVRNMMDHGLETADERRAAGKAEAGTLVLRSIATETHVVLELADDGRGIDWNAVARKASEAGLPVETPRDLEAALFHSGVSTAAAVTDLSGRGVGLSAVAERCAALGGTVRVHSERGRGTTFRFELPLGRTEGSLVPPELRLAG